MAREDFWKEVMLSWTLKDELESDTKEKLVSSQYFPPPLSGGGNTSWYYLNIFSLLSPTNLE